MSRRAACCLAMRAALRADCVAFEAPASKGVSALSLCHRACIARDHHGPHTANCWGALAHRLVNIDQQRGFAWMIAAAACGPRQESRSLDPPATGPGLGLACRALLLSPRAVEPAPAQQRLSRRLRTIVQATDRVIRAADERICDAIACKRSQLAQHIPSRASHSWLVRQHPFRP